MKVAKQTISLNGLRFYAYHGVEPQERMVGAWYTVGVSVNVQVADAVESDNLCNTVDYSKIADIVRVEMAVPCSLLEHIAGNIAAAILDRLDAVDSVCVCVTKHNPPVSVSAESASFEIKVERD